MKTTPPGGAGGVLPARHISAAFPRFPKGLCYHHPYRLDKLLFASETLNRIIPNSGDAGLDNIALASLSYMYVQVHS